MKNSKWLYINTKINVEWDLFFERWNYRMHLCWLKDEERGYDRFMFSIAKQLWYNDFEKQFNEILKQSVLLDLPLLTLYLKNDKAN